jgi:hypothetical protein
LICAFRPCRSTGTVTIHQGNAYRQCAVISMQFAHRSAE